MKKEAYLGSTFSLVSEITELLFIFYFGPDFGVGHCGRGLC